jgi:predicted ferric reductase
MEMIFLRSTLLRRRIGPASIVLLVVADGILWAVARPPGESTPSFVGQALGAEAMLLLSVGLVLISTLPWVESWFDGIDRAAIWHRRVAITGLALLVPHALLATNPDGTALGGPLGAIGLIGLGALVAWSILPRWRSVVPRRLRGLVAVLRRQPGVGLLQTLLGGYERWRALHRTTGVFVAAGFVHGALDATPFGPSPTLRYSYLITGGIGLAFYVYRELLARFFSSLHDYQVATVSGVGPGLVEIALVPIGRPMEFAPGQFAMLFLEAKDGWHRHPFTLASSPRERTLRIVVKALGDYTSRLPELVVPGMPAVIGGPYGRFSHLKGTHRQVWIAGGVGVTPFLSWLRHLDHETGDAQVDFFYTTSDGAAPFAEEIEEIASRHESLRAHLVDSSVEGRLTADRVLATVGGDPRSLSAFLCGPEPLVRGFQTQLRRAGVPARNIHREHFDWR